MELIANRLSLMDRFGIYLSPHTGHLSIPHLDAVWLRISGCVALNRGAKLNSNQTGLQFLTVGPTPKIMTGL